MILLTLKFSKGFADVVSGSFALITHSSWVRSPWVRWPLYTTNTANITINDFHLFILLSLLFEFIFCNGNTRNKLTIELGGGYGFTPRHNFLHSTKQYF